MYLLCPSHTDRTVWNISAEHLEGKPFEAVGDCPYCEDDGGEETPEGRDGHESWSIAPVVGEDGEEDGEHQLHSGLGGGNDVDELDGVFAGNLEPEREGLDAAGGLLGEECQYVIEALGRRCIDLQH